MSALPPHELAEPTRAALDARAGLLFIEFGAPWCGVCRAAQPIIAAALAAFPQMHHIRIADGRGKPLGRSLGVKLWPTLVILREGQELARVVRPRDAQAIESAVAKALARG